MMFVYAFWAAFCWVLRGGFFGKVARTYLRWEAGVGFVLGMLLWSVA